MKKVKNKKRNCFSKSKKREKEHQANAPIGLSWLRAKFISIVIFGYLVFITFYSYTYFLRSIFEEYFVLSVIFMTIITDGLILSLHLFRKPIKYKKLSFDSEKLTIVMACFNAEKIIAQTLMQALTHVPPNRIILISDTSCDKTADIARSLGIRVLENKVHMQKALSISRAMKYVTTPYVLVLDDDTLIGKTLIPTSLLDKGNAAVAFNVMPYPKRNLLNKLQRFEYRKSMIIGKSLRSKAGAVCNVSGAIGLFRTKDLKRQAKKHSGQYGGEDQQRTMLVHLEGSKKGVVFTPSKVYTKVPNTIKSWFKQRAKKWNSSTQELLTLSFRVIFSSRTHYLHKLNRAYYIWILLTDPLRLFALITLPVYVTLQKALIIYLFYTGLDFLAWLKTKRKDSFWIILIFPLYAKLHMIARLFAHFYWFYKKYEYILKKRWYRFVTQRNLLVEYSLVMIFLAIFLWPFSTGTFIKAGGKEMIAQMTQPVMETFKGKQIPEVVASTEENIGSTKILAATTEKSTEEIEQNSTSTNLLTSIEQNFSEIAYPILLISSPGLIIAAIHVQRKASISEHKENACQKRNLQAQ